ncbi:metallopeptidase family protein [Rhodovulum sp. 12E13]|uniref:metallopeptidase family protein n=1 Tax=Rhodovulum sp. 12E13 TaxID=2203891 RepID=UPI0018F483D2
MQGDDETGWADRAAPSAGDIAALAEAARAALPEGFAAAAREVAIRVEEFADSAMLAEVDLQDPFELTGLYDGIPLTERSVMDQPDRPDTIWLFRRPILDEWADRGDEPLGHLVAHVYVHELAHHFGWSDDDIAAIDRWWE